MASEAFAVEHGLLDQAVEILGMEMTSDLGFDMAAFDKTCACGGASRLLLRQQTHHIRGFGTVRGGQGRQGGGVH